MLETEEIKQIISSSIRSAVCIDDEYPEPYQEVSEGSQYKKEVSAALYRSFRENGKCDLDIYNFKGYDSFQHAKEYLFSNKELLILDWELTTTIQIKYSDSLKILQDAVNNDFIQFAAIYTQEPNTYDIAYKIYSYFSSTETIDDKQKCYDTWSEVIDDYLVSKPYEISIDNLLKVVNNQISGYTLYPSRRKDIENKIIENIRPLFNKEFGDFCKIFQETTELTTESFLIWHERFLDNSIIIRTDNENYSVKPIEIGLPALLINNTLVFILEKQQKGITKEGITPEDVYQQICNVISKIPNSKSLLFALRLKEILYKKLAVLGKGLGGIDEDALTYHANNYEQGTREGQFDYLVSCLSAHITQHITDNIKIQELENIFSEKSIKPSEEKLAALNSFLTFTKRNSNKNHQIKPGDIFKLDLPILKENSNSPYIEYIICVSQSCDCLRPKDKLSFNFSFTGGKAATLKTAVSNNVETEHFSFINDNNAIQWNLKLFTIYIEKYIFDIEEHLSVIINGKENNIEYIGNQKEIFTQRLINATFNQALRIGIDLPHYKK